VRPARARGAPAPREPPLAAERKRWPLRCLPLRPNKTVKVEPSAAEPLKTLKAGEKVKLTCRDNDKGEHEAVTHIAVEGAATAKAPTQK
jgi:hypothetical protein